MQHSSSRGLTSAFDGFSQQVIATIGREFIELGRTDEGNGSRAHSSSHLDYEMEAERTSH